MGDQVPLDFGWDVSFKSAMAFASLRSVLKVPARAALASIASPAPKFCQPVFLGSFRSFSDVKFTKTHEWLGADGDEYVMGISNFAANALGEVVYCDLPSEGATFSAKDTICTLESVKAVGEVYAPAECEVVEVNEKLMKSLLWLTASQSPAAGC